MHQVVLLGDGEPARESDNGRLQIALEQLQVAEKRVRDREARGVPDLGRHPERLGGGGEGGVEASQRALRLRAPAAQAHEDRIDEAGLVALGGRREELDADVELLDGLFEASHVAARDGGDEARVAARPQIAGISARRGLPRALERAV